MFEAKERQNFLDLIRPPTGYRVGSVVGTTYSLDFVAVTATLLALIDADGEKNKAVDSLHAITRLADRLQIYCNSIEGPHEVNRLTLLYTRLIQTVRTRDGCFHPKVWVAYYLPRKIAGAGELPGVVRVICSSRNLTTSQCWEAFVAFQGREGPAVVNEPLAVSVLEFLDHLRPKQGDVIAKLSHVLARTTFDMPRPLRDNAEFLWQQCDGKHLQRHLPPRGQRAMLVSPFVRKTFLQTLVDRYAELTVISTQRELDRIEDEALMSRLVAGRNRAFVVSPPEDNRTGTYMDLHAKLLVVENPKGSETFLGSANASSSAWKGLNAEAVVRFSPGVSINQFLDQFVYSTEPAKRGIARDLRGWIGRYERVAYTPSSEEKAKRELDEVCDGVARLRIRGSYDPTERILTLSLSAPGPDTTRLLNAWADACDLQMTLLSQLAGHRPNKPLLSLIEGAVEFEDVGIADLTDFLVVQVTHRKEKDVQRRPIIKLEGDFRRWWEQRDAELVKSLLTRDALKQLLSAIVFGAAMRPPTRVDSQSMSSGRPQVLGGLLSELSIEDVLRSCTEDPGRIGEINSVLAMFDKTGYIDAPFRQFWYTFLKADAAACQAVNDD